MLVFFQIFFITARSSSLACSRFPGFKEQMGTPALLLRSSSPCVLTTAAPLPAQPGWEHGPRRGAPLPPGSPQPGPHTVSKPSDGQSPHCGDNHVWLWDPRPIAQEPVRPSQANTDSLPSALSLERQVPPPSLKTQTQFTPNKTLHSYCTYSSTPLRLGLSSEGLVFVSSTNVSV